MTIERNPILAGMWRETDEEIVRLRAERAELLAALDGLTDEVARLRRVNTAMILILSVTATALLVLALAMASIW